MAAPITGPSCPYMNPLWPIRGKIGTSPCPQGRNLDFPVVGSIDHPHRSDGVNTRRQEGINPFKRRIVGRVLGILGVLIVALAAAGCNADFAAPPTQPNIVLIYVDDLGWSDVGFNGSLFYETPHLDALARDGIVFSNAYANAPNCAPSRASLMTGQYTPRHKIYTVGNPARGQEGDRRMISPANTRTLATRYVTVAEKLRDAGYATAHIGKWHLGADGYLPEHQGFDVNVGGYASGSPQGGYFPPYRNPSLSDGPPEEYLTDRLTDEALSFVTRSASQPFFLYLAHYAVHTPIQAKAALIAKYESRTPVGDQSNATYAAMIESMDQSVGRVLAHLDSLGLGPDTAVIFYSDNGGAIQATSNAPLRGFKGMLYEGGIRVPLAIRWTGRIAPGRAEKTPVIGSDLYPTLLEFAGAAPPAHTLDGISLMPLLEASGPVERRSLFWHFPAYLEMPKGFPGPWRTTPAGAVRHGSYKLIEFFEDGSLELYNLADDLGETTNLAAQEPELTRDLHTRLQAWRTSIGADMPEPK